MKIKEIVNNNIKLYLIMGIIIVLGTLGITFAAVASEFNPIAVNTTAGTLDANISYEGTNNTSVINSTGKILPISDSIIESEGVGIDNPKVLKAEFNVKGVENNPANTIYDIALYAEQIDCELRTEDVKWRLYKNEQLISHGNLSPTFDVMDNGRLVLTNTQQDLTLTSDKYTFILWISESCNGDITTCDPSLEQSKYLNKQITGSIKIELATKSKKVLQRVTGSELSCGYTEVAVPLCNVLTYNGQEQQLVNITNTSASGINNSTGYKVLPLGVTRIANTNSYTLNNNKGTNAGEYPVILSLKEGYKWTDGSTDDKCIYCTINKKDLTITTSDQNIKYGETISNTTDNVNVNGLISGHSLSNITLDTTITEVGTGSINASNIKITDSNSNDVTKNYNINKNNSGVIQIECLNIATEPTVSDKLYTGSTQIGVTEGNYTEISGSKSAIRAGKYTVTAVPQKNYCWQDKTTTPKEYTWNITRNTLNITLINKNTDYTGSKIEIDEPTVTDITGATIENTPIIYKYYNTNDCSGNPLRNTPINAGDYSVKAFTEDDGGYEVSESNCAVLTINKIEPEFTIEQTEITLIHPNSNTITYTYSGDGNINCNSSNTEIVTCSVNETNNEITLIPVSEGTTTITVAANQGTNYLESDSKNISVIVTYKTYNITLDNQNATTAGTTTIYGRYGDGLYLDNVYNQNMTATTNAITIPTKNGYIFDGYYTSNENNDTQLINSSGYITTEFKNNLYDNDITLYAKWMPIGYNITYNLNEGTLGSNAPEQAEYNEIISISNPTRNGWTFTGWTFNGDTANAMYGTNSSSVTTPWNNKNTYITAEYFKNLNITNGTTVTMTAHWVKTVTGTFNYYNGTSQATAESQCQLYDTDTMCSFSLPNVVSSSTGPDGATYQGISSSPSSTTLTTTYNSVYLNYYTVYKGTITANYTKENDNVASIGKTMDSCETYKYYNGSSYTSTTCNITLPNITAASNATVDGWYDSLGTKVGIPADIIAISSNSTFIAKANRTLTSSDFSYDNTNSGSTCTDVTCALDELYEKTTSQGEGGDNPEAITLSPGLYDTNDNLLADWDTLVNQYGLDVTIDYTSSTYKTETTSPYYILNNNTELSTGTKLIMGSNVTNIGNYAFYYCNNVTNITIPDGTTTIGTYAFSSCSNLTNITLPESLITIGNYAFYNCKNLTDTRIPNNVTTIGVYAFNNTAITSVTIPDSVTTISSNAFQNCPNLTSIKIGSGVSSISALIVGDCPNLTTISVDPNNTFYHSDGNCLIQTETKKIVAGCKNSIIPTDGSVTTIGNYAFGNCDGLTNITLPNTITSIGQNAFQNTKELTSITIPDSVTTIGNYAFSSSGLTSATIGNGVTAISENAFASCTNLTDVTIGDSVTTIGKRAFGMCTSLTNIIIPDSVTTIEANAFQYCSGLTNITMGSGVTTIGASAFTNCKALTSITIPNSVTTINERAFQSCSNLDNITIGSGVTTIGNYAFAQCTKLTNITIPDNVTTIGNYVFYGNTALTNTTIGTGVTRIGQSAFYNCNNLTTLTFKDTSTWYRTTSSTATSGGTATTVTNASTAATYLKNTYNTYYWYKL